MVNILKFLNTELQIAPLIQVLSPRKRLKNLRPSERRELKEKIYSAEKNISHIRVIVIALNIVVFLFLMDKKECIESLAWLVIVSGASYSLYFVVFQPYKKHRILLTSYFTSGMDALLITLWITATGGFESPFYVLWYVSVLAIALRYTLAVTLKVAMLYSLIYFLILIIEVDLFNHLTEVVVRIGYLLLISSVGGLLSKDINDQIKAKLIIKKSELEIKKREAMLQEAHNKLEERVRERTQELNQANLDLQKINEDIDNFVYATSHDLKSPLLNLQSLMNMVFDDLTDHNEESIAMRNKIQSSLERMKGAINHLSQVAKAQNEIYTDIEPIRFEEILNEVIADNEEIIKKAKATIHSHFVHSDHFYYSRSCIKSILYNFITNAIKYSSPSRGPIMIIKTELRNEQLILSVQDNGLGIDLTKNGSNLFTIFKRFHNHVEGAGIGLYMVKRIVEKNKGKIEVESQVDKGSTFRIIFKAA